MRPTKRCLTRLYIGLFCLGTPLLTGCSVFNSHIHALPANRLPSELLRRPRMEMQELSISRLRQDPPRVYQLAAGDILGVYIQDILGAEDESPPVHFPENGHQLPALGFPVPVREDGTLALPYIAAVPVEGLTLTQATEKIRETYAEQEVLREGQTKIIVTLMRRRQYRVTVIREETGGREGLTKRGTGEVIDLPAYENDVLHALNETGGLPGLDARNEIYILRGNHLDGEERDRMIAMISSCREPCQCPPAIPEHPSVIRIPIRFYPEELPRFTQEDIILQTGDIVYIPARDAEVFYTGGVLPGGEFLLPRDYDLDALAAISFAKGTVGSVGTGIGGGGGGRGGMGGMGGGMGGGGASPSDLLIIRKLPCGGQLPIRVDVNRALTDSSQRILIQPGDTLILRYTLGEEVYNAALNIIRFNFLFGLRGGGIF